MHFDQPAPPEGARAPRLQAQIPAEAAPPASMRRAELLSFVLCVVLSLSPIPASAQTPVTRAYAAATTKPAAQPAAAQSTRLAIPKPAAPSQAETDHMARLDKAIAPALARTLSKEDSERLVDAVRAVVRQDLAKAAEIKGQIGDATARRIVDWYRLRGGQGEAAEYRSFLDQNPVWPERTLLRQRLEEALFAKGGGASEIKSYFNGSEPQTGAGAAALASAFLAEGNEARAKALAVKAWREDSFPAALEAAFVERFRRFLTEADHKWRLDRLLLDDLRWTRDRDERAAVVRRNLPLLSAPERKKAEARLAVFLRAKNAKRLMDAIPAEKQPDWGFLYNRIQLLRRANKHEEAHKLLLGAPTEAAKVVSPDDWWDERRAHAYEALDAGKPKLAYEIVREAGPLSANPLKEQHFMAGWLALRYLKDVAAAERHFQIMRKSADGPLSRGKSEYWLGRALEARGDRAGASEHYRLAARESDTFHGQLARTRLEAGPLPLKVAPPVAPTSEQLQRFNDLDPVKAAVIISKSGLDHSLTRAFLHYLRTYLSGEAEVAMVAHLAQSLGDTQASVRIAKGAIAGGQNLHYYAYPVDPFPAYSAQRKPPEAAVLLGIARQESEFNTLIVSGAGAQGLLQVMPVTAKHVCRDYKVKCELKRLLTDKPYNVMLASAYIADRLDEFSGSYVLTLAGYNAGPGRARQWIRQFGDPRDPKVDVVDWIERIPFQETREYVAKVLSNIQIYRARLGEAATALRLDEDLNRGSQRVETPAAGALGGTRSDG